MKRLGKQRVECMQIILALCGREDDYTAWRNHPASQMWRHHIRALAEYTFAMCSHWRSLGYRDVVERDVRARLEWAINNSTYPQRPGLPTWLGDDRLHASHRSNLLRKDPVFYGKFNWREPSTLPYFWPGSDGDAPGSLSVDSTRSSGVRTGRIEPSPERPPSIREVGRQERTPGEGPRA
jgi:hypothetical protein